MSDSVRLNAMRQGGAALATVRDALVAYTTPGVSFAQIEAQAQKEIAKRKMLPSFSTVEDYRWATCIMKNDALLHGIPNQTLVENGDVITIDVGLIHQGFHVDTSVSFAVGAVSAATTRFLEHGEQVLEAALAHARVGATVYELSRAMEKGLQRYGYGAVYQMVGHGIGTSLHMEPNIPCVARASDKRIVLTQGQTLAIEVMYTRGRPDLVLDDDGWTYRTQDGSLSAMFEHTVIVGQNGPEVVTR